jgi:hypothetical protein
MLRIFTKMALNRSGDVFQKGCGAEIIVIYTIHINASTHS